ncbi:MAG: CheR family methyltransferase [Acidiferrobacter sp.]
MVDKKQKRGVATPSPRRPRRFPIVGIGASAGGLEAFTQLLRHLPADTGMGFVLVQHLAPTHPSALVHLLSSHTAMPVREAVDNRRVMPDHVYIISPNTILRIVNGILKVQAREQVAVVSYAIDTLLESLAHDRGEQAIGVILSGNASDGTLGLEAIKAHGGITFVQDDSAQYNSMPHSAIAAGCVDCVLSPESIAQELARMARHPYIAPHDPSVAEPSLRPVSPTQIPAAPAGRPRLRVAQAEGGPVVSEAAGKDFSTILRYVRNHTQVDFSAYKFATIARRVTRRMALNGMIGFEEYARFLRSDVHEIDRLYMDLLISVTGFFRDPEAFEALRREVFPTLLRSGRHERPRVWVPGCSTGQEAYSLAMAFAEFSERTGPTCSLQIFATDLNEALVEKARIAFYPETIARDITPERLRRFFTAQEGGGYRVNKELRERIVFAHHNLLSDPPFSRLDLVSCRNLMIYLDSQAQKRVVSTFAYALKPDGFLFLGTSDSVGSAVGSFQALDKKHKIYKKRSEGGMAAPLPLPSADYGRKEVQSKTSALPPVAGPYTTLPELNVQREADRITVKRFAPPGVLINADLDVLQFRGSTSPLLGPPSSKARFNVLDMARGDFRLPLRSIIQRAKKEDQSVRRERVRVTIDDHTYPLINIEVIPLKNVRDRHYLVLFEPAAGERIVNPEMVAITDGAPPQGPDKPRSTARQEGVRRIRQLERELAETRDYVQALQEQYETANEELQTSNEEAQSANEELQSTNEQLETSKEELDSANEELITINGEMVHRNTELSRLNDDLNNLYASVNLPILVFTRDLRIRSFTAPAAKLFNLLVSDVGQSINAIQHRLKCADLGPRTAAAIDTLSAQEYEIQDKDDNWYLARIQPYLTQDMKIDGAVLVLVDISALKRSTIETRRALEYAEAMLRTARVPLVALRSDLGVNTANAAFYKAFNLSPAEVEGQSIFSLSNGAWDIPELRTLLLEILPRDRFLNDYQVVHEFPALGRRTMILNARRMADTGESAEMIVLSIEDITEQQRSRESVRRSEVHFRRLFEAAQDGILILEPASGRIVDANPLITSLSGYTREELIGKELWQVGFFQDAAAYHNVLTQLRKTGSIRYEHLRLQGKDGQVHAIEFVGNTYEEDGAKVIQCNIRDVTVRMRTIEALRESEARFHAIADNVPVMIWMRNPDNRVTYFSRGWQEFVGGVDDKAKDDFWQAAIHPDDRARCLDEYTRAFASRKRFELKYRLQKHEGEYCLILDVGIPLMVGNKFNGFIGSCIDITEREQIDNELSKSSKLESIGILAGGIAHDFNNLLTAIIGNIGLARLSVEPGGELFNSLIAAEYAGLRARDLAQQLLIFARGGAPVRRTVSLGGLLEAWIAFALRGSNIKVTFLIAPDLWRVDVDEGQLSQVINNLIINAQQAMPEGGVITVTAENVTHGADSGLPFTGDYVRTAITDQGAGIPKEQVSKIFDPFFTTKLKGTGLGLATSYAIIKKHQGYLTVESEPGQGATFFVYLPASGRELARTPDKESAPRLESGKILFMDDEPMIRRFAAEALASFGYQIECVEDGNKAVEYYRRARERGEPYDGVILDLTVPGGMGGKEAMQALLEVDPAVQAIVSSGYSNDPILANFRVYGFCGRIVKPYPIDELRDVVSALVNRTNRRLPRER